MFFIVGVNQGRKDFTCDRIVICDRCGGLLDFGTGKGRVCFFLAYQSRCRCIGVEYDEQIYARAADNLKHAVSGRKPSFVLKNAEKYIVGPDEDRCYFFNPFSVEILRKVLTRIRESWYKNPRQILLFFYYPSEEYVSLLMTEEELIFVDEIDCRDLFEGNVTMERILIFQIGD